MSTANAADICTKVRPHAARLRICFVSPTLYPVLDPGSGIAATGGAETQQLCLGQAFLRAGHQVHVVTRDHGQPDPCTLGGFVVHKTYRPSQGIPGLRFYYPRVPAIWRALARADADVYYVRGAGYLVALVARFAKFRGRRAIFAVAHDANVDPGIRRLPTRRDQWLYERGVQAVDSIVVQTTYQARLLQQNYGRSGHLIRNVWPDDAGTGNGTDSLPVRDTILWVAMYRDIKQPEHFLRLAASMPSLRFVMVGGPHPGSEALFRRISEQARGVPNLEVAGFKTLAETGDYYRRARALVNTSRHEGFPNTFLQAWAEGIPVVSYVDPDQVISGNGLGCVAADERGLGGALQQALDGTADGPGGRSRIRAYFTGNHAPEQAVRSYTKLFADMHADGGAVGWGVGDGQGCRHGHGRHGQERHDHPGRGH